MIKIAMVGLGCPKNQVDGEIMLSTLLKAGYEIVNNIDEADVLIINTCGFIEDAKKEAIGNILEACELKTQGVIKGVIVSGCLSERYQSEVMKEIPEIDACIGIGANGKIAEIVDQVLKGKKVEDFPSKYDLCFDGDRVLTTPSHYAYLKIAEGCSNCCTYCAIPKIRGRMRSRKMESIIKEAESLAENGVKELIVVAQDTTKYGLDLYGELSLAKLLKKLCEIDGIEWIRTLYSYPESITDELIETIKSEKKLCKYLDIPIQHISERILKLMNRKGNKRELKELFKKLKKEIPDITLRTTLICGFPSEGEEEFLELCEFVNEIEFDRLGCFPYSPEEGTAAANFEDQISEEIKNKRAEIIMNQQYRIMDKNQEDKVGKVVSVIVDSFDEDNMFYVGRSAADAPEIDTSVIISTEDELFPGDIIQCKIIGTDEFDLVGEAVLI